MFVIVMPVYSDTLVSAQMHFRSLQPDHEEDEPPLAVGTPAADARLVGLNYDGTILS